MTVSLYEAVTEFHNTLRTLTPKVLAYVCDDAELAEHPSVPLRARDIVTTDMVNRLWLFSQRLLDEKVTEEEAPSRVQYLAAVAVCLYFVGAPFPQPWGRVLRWVEQKGGGLPNGVCVAKAIGDLVRSARKENVRRRSIDQANPPETLYILTHLPLAFMPDLVNGDHRQTGVPAEAHVLAHCYELLQLRLYAREGLPFQYLIPDDIVRSELTKANNAADRWGEMLTWSRKIFQHPHENQLVSVIRRPEMPACFLNHSSGLYTFETIDPIGPVQEILPASFMKPGRLQLYRDRLKGLQASERWINLLVCGTDDASAAALALREVVKTPNAAAPSLA